MGVYGSAMKTVLIVEDDVQIARLVRDYLEHAGYAVLTAGEGEAALHQVRAAAPDLMVLDLGLPGMDGLDVTRAVRSFSALPIIVLTARADETDRVVGLELGADDYVVKPFSPRELVARVRAVLRRAEGAQQTPDVLRAGALTIDVAARRVTAAGDRIELMRPSSTCWSAARHPGRVLTAASSCRPCAAWPSSLRAGDRRTHQEHPPQARRSRRRRLADRDGVRRGRPLRGRVMTGGGVPGAAPDGQNPDGPPYGPPWRRRWSWSRGGPPPWWPEDESWPPEGGWRLRRRFVRRIALLLIAFVLLLIALSSVWSIYGPHPGFVRPGRGWPHSPAALLPLMIVVIIGAIVVGRVLRRTAAPIGDVMDAADRVAAGDYSARVQARGSGEVRRLADSFNEMAQSARRCSIHRPPTQRRDPHSIAA